MGTTRGPKAATARHGKHLPEFALKIRELREQCGMTQPKFAAELGTTRGAIAKWEAADRAPNEESYKALVLFARRRSLKVYEEFFSSRLWETVRHREHAVDEADARRFYLTFQKMAYGVDLERLAKLSKSEFIKEQVNRVFEARKTLTNGEMAKAFVDIASETFYFEQLSMPGGLEAFRRLLRLQREVADFRNLEGTDPAAMAESRRRIVRQMLDGWALGVLEGKIPDRNQLDKKLSENNLIGAILAKVSGVMAAKWSAEKEGKPYSDADFIDDVSWALGSEASPKSDRR
jgi:DNA-binding transcriptional regulator YiaG